MPEIANNSIFSQTDASNTTSPGRSGSSPANTIDTSFQALIGAVKREHDWRNFTVTSGGTANAQTLTYAVAPAAYYAGQVFGFTAGATNTGAMTLNVNGLGAKNVLRLVPGTAATTTSLVAGDIRVNTQIVVEYDGTSMIVISSGTSGAYLNDLQQRGMQYGWTVGGTANAITLTNAQGPSVYTFQMRVDFKVGTTNTGAATVNVNAAGVKSIYKLAEGGLAPLAAGDLVALSYVSLIYDGADFIIEHSQPLPSRVVVLTPTSVGTSTTYTTPSIVQNFSKMYLRYSGISHDNASSRVLQIQVSSDGGGTWSTAVNLTTAVAAAISLGGVVNLWDTQAGTSTVYYDSTWSDGTTTGLIVGAAATSDATKVDAVRLLWNGAGNFDGGTVMLIGEM